MSLLPTPSLPRIKRTLTFEAQTLANAYGLLCAGLLFLWPVVTGIPGIESRFLWLSIALPMLLLSFTLLTHALKGIGPLHWHLPPWSICGGLIVITGMILAYTTSIPPLAFSDELTIAIPGVTVAYKLASFLGWPMLITLTVLLCVGGFALPQRCNHRCMVGLVFALWLVAVTMALTGIESGLALRYPPVMHAVQLFATILTAGSPLLLRAPNVLWTMLLGLMLWQLLPEWPTRAKIGMFAAILLGPLGWTYRIVLYQACAELTVGATTTLLLWHMVRGSERRDLAGAMGATFGLWFLIRPTSLAALAGALLLLALLRRWKDILWALSVALPIIVAWLALSPLFTAQYNLTSSGMLPTSLLPLSEALRALPRNFHPIGLAILLSTSFFALFAGSREQRLLLLAAWSIALPPALLQHLLAGPTFYGVARYNVLLLLPQACAIGMLFAGLTTYKRLGVALGTVSLLALLWITPFRFASFLQEERATSKDIYRTPSEGYLPLPLQQTLEELLPLEKETIVIVAPHYTLLDFFVARHTLTLAERSSIIARSRAWSQDSTVRPVVIQAPTVAPYQPNLTQEEEDRLRSARIWALKQPHHILRYGMEETIIAP